VARKKTVDDNNSDAGGGGGKGHASESIWSMDGKGKGSGFDLRLIFPLLILILMMGGGLWAITHYVAEERARDVTQLQVRMGIIAESRAGEIDRWLKRQMEEIRALSENQSLQLYVGSIKEMSADPAQADQVAGLTEYLRNLLAVTASRGQFIVEEKEAPIAANVAQPGTGGLLVADNNNKLIAASPASPPFEGAVADFAAATPAGESRIGDLFLDGQGRPAIMFCVPLYAVQTDGAASTQIGRIIGVKEVGRELYPLLRQPGDTSASGLAILLQNRDGQAVYLSPVSDPTQPVDPLKLGLALDTPDLDAAFAVRNPNGFATDKRNYRGKPVAAIAHSLTEAPWILLYTVDYQEALGASDRRFRNLTLYLALALGLFGVALVAIWRHGASRRANAAAKDLAALAQRLREQSDLLQLVTDSQPTGIFIIDRENRYRFVNSGAAKAAGTAASDMIGKSIGNVLGAEAAKRYLKLSQKVRGQNLPVSDINRIETEEGKPRIIEAAHIPLPDTGALPGAILTVEHDVTDAVTERERRVRILNQTVRTLVAVVDKRDPYAANHSLRVARIAQAIAHEMGLGDTEIETAEIAGSLLNLGKILMPRDLLGKPGELTKDELKQVRNSLQASADLLEGIEFDGPVVETLRQARAHWDGSGQPEGLAGENILPTARVIAVANAFVSMISARAFRQAMTVDQAIDILLKNIGKIYDRRVVAALINYLDNHGGRDALSQV